jgi:hypothetical protein
MAAVPAAADDVIMRPRKPTPSSGPRQVEVIVSRGHRESGGRERDGRAVGMGTFLGVGVGVAGIVSGGTTQRLVSAWVERSY